MFWNPFKDYATTQEALAQMRDARADAAINQLKQAAMPNLLQQAQEEGSQSIQQNADNLKYLVPFLQNRAAIQQQNLKYNPQILNARLNLLRAQAQNEGIPDYQSPLGKMVSDYTQYSAKHGANSPISRALLAQIQATQQGNGVQSTIMPSGGKLEPGAAIGASSVPGIPLQQNSRTPVMMQNQSDLAASPFAPQSRYTTASRTLLDPKTGNYVSVPTQENVGIMQKALSAEEAADSVTQDLIGNVSPELGGIPGIFKRGEGLLTQAAGGNSVPYANYSAAISTEIPGAAEQLINAYGFKNAGIHLANMVRTMITPSQLDTPYSYAVKIAQARAMLSLRSGQYRDILKGGYSLQKDSSGKPTMHSLTNFMLNRMGYGNTIANNINSNVGENISIPDSFPSKAAFLKWKQSASPQAQQMALQKFGGG
jgi:hypothetical protein